MKKAGRPSLRPDSNLLLSMYDCMTASELAIHFCVSIPTVRRWVSDARNELDSFEKK